MQRDGGGARGRHEARLVVPPTVQAMGLTRLTVLRASRGRMRDVQRVRARRHGRHLEHVPGLHAMTGPRLTAQAWRGLVCIVDADLDPDAPCPCTPETDAELERAGLVVREPFAITPAGLVARGRLAHAAARVVR